VVAGALNPQQQAQSPAAGPTGTEVLDVLESTAKCSLKGAGNTLESGQAWLNSFLSALGYVKNMDEKPTFVKVASENGVTVAARASTWFGLNTNTKTKHAAMYVLGASVRESNGQWEYERALSDYQEAGVERPGEGLVDEFWTRESSVTTVNTQWSLRSNFGDNFFIGAGSDANWFVKRTRKLAVSVSGDHHNYAKVELCRSKLSTKSRVYDFQSERNGIGCHDSKPFKKYDSKPTTVKSKIYLMKTWQKGPCSQSCKETASVSADGGDLFRCMCQKRCVEVEDSRDEDGLLNRQCYDVKAE
jgi:hypothetical protein